MKITKGYRKNVGLVILNKEGDVLLCKRKNTSYWQFPQGGIDKKELPLDAAYRELYEEVNISKDEISLIAEAQNWINYDVPAEHKKFSLALKNFKGQTQKWFLFMLKKKVHISFNNDTIQEFDDYKWVSYWYPLNKIIWFKRDVYKQVLREFAKFYSRI